MSPSNDNKVTVITGGSSGIGAATARLLAQRGHALVLAARSMENLQDVAVGIARETKGARVHIVEADVTNRDDVLGIREDAVSVFGRVDVWINNAGQGITRSVLDLTDADVDQMVAVNLHSVVYGMQTIVPYFQKRGSGHLINISSFLGRVPVAPQRSLYSAMKAATNILTANLRMDLRATHPGVHVTLVMPAIVSTEFAAHALWSIGTQPAPPMAVSQTADDVAKVIADVIDQPVAEVYTNPASHERVRRYYDDVEAFESEGR